MTTAHDVKQGLARAARGPWMQRAAGVGFVATGVVYAVIGIYALMLASGHGGGFLSAQDAPRAVQRQPFGDVLLVALALGLACHALWRFVEAAFERPRGKSQLARIGKRLGAVGGGLVSTLLSLTAFQHLVGRARPHGSWVQRVLRWDGGDWIVIAVGVGVAIAGGFQIYRACTPRYREDLETAEMSATERRWLMRISRFGVGARGAVLIVGGWLCVQAGLHLDPKKSIGTGAALRTIAQQAWGMALLAIAAAGLLAYALFMMVNARYRRACG